MPIRPENRQPFHIKQEIGKTWIFCNPRPDDPDFMIDIMLPNEALAKMTPMQIIDRIITSLNACWHALPLPTQEVTNANPS